MEVSVSIFWMFGIIILALIIGFLIGRNERKAEKQDEIEEENDSETFSGGRRKCGYRVFEGKSIASPVDGKVHFFCESGRKGVMLEPKQGKIYAPVSGKIIKVYPMGNAFLLRADEGTELLIRVGNQHPDELCSMYFRTRIVENEIVNKGKLLLEFDKEGLLAAGEEVGVTICPESGTEEEIIITENETVKVGEEILRIGVS